MPSSRSCSPARAGPDRRRSRRRPTPSRGPGRGRRSTSASASVGCPQAHLTLAREIDTNRDGAFSLAEVKAAPLVQGVRRADVVLRGFEGELLSLGFQVHLAPCVEGRCIDAAAGDRCHDRVRDGDETGVDCGGICGIACSL